MRTKITPSLVISVLALSIALGGTSYAISKLPANSVGSKQIKKSAVNSAKVKDKSLLAKDFKPGQIPAGKTGATGAAGEVGATGATGATGSALAYAYVEDTGTVNVPVEDAKGITTAMVTRPSLGVYCFQLESIWPVHIVTATPEPAYGNTAESDKIIFGQVIHNDDFGLGCPADSDAVVTTKDLSLGTYVNWFYNVSFN